MIDDSRSVPSNRIAQDIRSSFSGKGWPSYAPDAPALLNFAAREIDRQHDEIERLVHDIEQASKAAGIEATENERLRAALEILHPRPGVWITPTDSEITNIDTLLSGDSPVSSDDSGRPNVLNGAVNASTSAGPGSSDETKKETNRDKVLRGEVVRVSDDRLREMQEQAIRNQGIGDGYMHWHWSAVINELIVRRSADETPKLSNKYLSDNVERLSKFYDAVKPKLTMAEQNELWSIVGNLGNLSVGRWATDDCSNQSAGLSKYARDWLVNLRRESGGYPAEVLRHINILEIDVQRAERISDHLRGERDRLHKQLLQHAEVCGESAYPLGERVTDETDEKGVAFWKTEAIAATRIVKAAAKAFPNDDGWLHAAQSFLSAEGLSDETENDDGLLCEQCDSEEPLKAAVCLACWNKVVGEVIELRKLRDSAQETSTPRCHFMAFRDPQFRCTKPAGHTDEHSCGLAPATEPVEKATALQRELSEGAHADWVAGAMGLVDACAERASEPVVEPAPHRHYTVTKEEQDDLDRIAAAEKASEQECRSAGPSGNAAGTGLVDRQAEARLSRREITAQKASADCTGCGGKPEFPNIPCSICGRYPDGTSV